MPSYNTVNAGLNISHIIAGLESYEAARNAFFVLHIPADQLKNLYSTTATEDPYATGAQVAAFDSGAASQGLSLNVTKASVPQFSVGVEKYRRGNDEVKFATVPTWESGTVEVDDVVGINTKEILTSWLYLAYNPHTRMGGRMKNYKKNGYLVEYTQDYQKIRTWEIEGMFISKISESEFDRENDGKRKLSVTIEYDRAYLSAVDANVDPEIKQADSSEQENEK